MIFISIIIIIMTQVVEGKGKLMDNLSNYIIVDIGANLTNKKFSRDLDQVIQRATDSGEEDHLSKVNIVNHSHVSRIHFFCSSTIYHQSTTIIQECQR